MLRNHFGRTLWYSKVTWVKRNLVSVYWEPVSVQDRLKRKLVSVRLEVVLILTQDRCMVCAKCTVGSEIVLDAPDATPR